jgi:hypothetical protein
MRFIAAGEKIICSFLIPFFCRIMMAYGKLSCPIMLMAHLLSQTALE